MPSRPSGQQALPHSRAERATLAGVFAQQTLAQWRERLEPIDCCVTPILTFEEALADAQFVSRAMCVTRPDGARQLAPPFKLTPPAFDIARDAPAQGEHTDDLLRDAGYSGEAIEALVREGAVKRAS